MKNTVFIPSVQSCNTGNATMTVITMNSISLWYLSYKSNLYATKAHIKHMLGFFKYTLARTSAQCQMTMFRFALVLTYIVTVSPHSLLDVMLLCEYGLSYSNLLVNAEYVIYTIYLIQFLSFLVNMARLCCFLVLFVVSPSVIFFTECQLD